MAKPANHFSGKSSGSAVVAERKRIARDLHDTLAQGFTGVLMQLHAAAEALSQNSPLLAAEFVNRASDIAREGLRETRRTVAALRLPGLHGKTLCEALHGLIMQKSYGASLRTQFLYSAEKQVLPEAWEENLFHIAQEALTNTIRHARASEFQAQLFFDANEARLNLHDNGRGFDPDGQVDGFGLLGMRERVQDMGGHLSIQSTKDTGTSISVILDFAGST